jgi:hypothetical protein
MGPPALLALEERRAAVLLSSLKIHRPRLGLNPRTLGPTANNLLNPMEYFDGCKRPPVLMSAKRHSLNSLLAE